jgi:hypothetical protein
MDAAQAGSSTRPLHGTGPPSVSVLRMRPRDCFTLAFLLLGACKSREPAPSTTATTAPVAVASAALDGAAAPSSTATAVDDADPNLTKARVNFHACYLKGRSGDPTMTGKVVVRAMVEPNGRVASASVFERHGLSESVAACILARVEKLTLKPTGATEPKPVDIPLTFPAVTPNDAGADR